MVPSVLLKYIVPVLVEAAAGSAVTFLNFKFGISINNVFIY